ncbi:hypothetical protein CHISP_1015 [Chitinispirillum alkaliphilum]|nr:hypothetical protein CHISP_1015 [Chitinispirillum alkaliphilum]
MLIETIYIHCNCIDKEVLFVLNIILLKLKTDGLGVELDCKKEFKFVHLYRFTRFMIASAFVLCYATNNDSRETNVIYPVLYGNYQRNGFMESETSAKGEIDWFIEVGSPSGKAVLLVEGHNYYLYKHNVLYRFSMDTEIIWHKSLRGWMDPVIQNKKIYFAPSSRLCRINQDKETEETGFHIPDINNFTSIIFFKPHSENYLVQTFMQNETGRIGDYVRIKTKFHIIDSSGNLKYTDSEAAQHAPAVITNDDSVLVVITGSGEIRLINPITGTLINRSNLKRRGARIASIDMFDNLLILGNTTTPGERLLMKTTLDGSIVWEYLLSTANIRCFVQPPASDRNGRVYFIHANTLLRINKDGELEREYSLQNDSDFQFVTVLNDNSVLVTSGNMLMHLDPSGDEVFTLHLDERERIAAPPVVDNDGGVMLATLSGRVYRIK